MSLYNHLSPGPYTLSLHDALPICRAVSTISLTFQGMPQFWVGIMLVIIFSATLNVLPSSGFTTPLSLVMPAVALSLPYVGWLTRSVRNSVMEELDRHYVRTARANGRSEEHTSELQSRGHLVCRLVLEERIERNVYFKE